MNTGQPAVRIDMEKGDVIVKSLVDRKPPVTNLTVLDSQP